MTDTVAETLTEEQPEHEKDRRSRLARTLHAWHRRSIVSGVDHPAVLERVHSESAWSGRYAFMTAMSAGIAILGLLLSSPAVVIGAMLISPLMGPIIGLGFALATFDWVEVRRSLVALIAGSLLALGFSAIIVLLSPLKDITPEIAARIRPNLFDLLVAIFSALAGTYATVRGRGETIVGVAIATALMPPLAVVGFGLATGNAAVFGGALGLFLTNFFAISLSATFVARFYGFSLHLSPEHSRHQAFALLLVFAMLAIPLAISLRHIAWEAWATRTARSAVQQEFGKAGRIALLEPDFTGKGVTFRTTVISDVYREKAAGDLNQLLTRRLSRPVNVELSQIVVNRGAEQEAIERAQAAAGLAASSDRLVRADIATQVSLALGVSVDDVVVDPVTRRVTARIPQRTSLLDAWATEFRMQGAQPTWKFEFLPAAGPLPELALPETLPPLPSSQEGATETEASETPTLAQPSDPVLDAKIDAWSWAIRRLGTTRVSVAPRRLQGEPLAAAVERGAWMVAALSRRGIEAQLAEPIAANRDRERELGLLASRTVRIDLLQAATTTVAPADTAAKPPTKEAAA